MKKISLFLVALAAVCSCSKNEMPIQKVQNEGEKVAIIANTTLSEDSKVTMGALSDGVYPISWNETGEVTFLRECVRTGNTGTIADCGSSSYKKVDAKNASFSFEVEAKTTEADYDYVAVYPCHPTDYKTNLDHGVRYGGDDQKNCVSYILNHTKTQVPLADAPDPATHIMMAQSLNHPAQATSLSLNFKYVVGFGKMTIKNFPALAQDETVSKITITVPETKKITGRVYNYYHDNTEGTRHAGDVVPYNSANVKNYVMIDPSNISFNTTGFDVWFTALPVSLAEGETLNIAITTNKNNYVFDKVLSKNLAIEAGKVSSFTIDYEKRIKTDFTVTFPFKTLAAAAAKWPTSSGESWSTFENCDSGLAVDNDGTEDPSNPHRRMTANLTVGEDTYTFVLATCDGATSHAIFWNVSKGIQANAQRYFGLPVIDGMKIKKIEYTNGASNQSSDTYRYVGVVDEILAQTSSLDEGSFVEGGALIPNGKSGAGTTKYVFNVENPLDDTNKTGKRLYLFCYKQTSIFQDITVTYAKVSE